MYACVYVSACMYASKCVCMRQCMSGDAVCSKCLHVRMYAYLHVCIFVRISVCVCTCMHIGMYVSMHIHVVVRLLVGMFLCALYAHVCVLRVFECVYACV